MSVDAQVIVIVGPTCSGKTKLAINWAQRLGCNIINFDSRQVYRELNIGVARPSAEELNQVEHLLIASHSILNPINASSFNDIARKHIKESIEKYGRVVLVGGTGLYLKALLEGLDDLPEIDLNIRRQVQEIYEKEGLTGIGVRLYQQDSRAFEWIEKDNPARIMRALEICLGTGLSVEEWRKKQGTPLPHSYKIWGIETQRDQLYHNINHRVDLMLKEGFETEVKSLIAYKEHWVMKTVGYQEFFQFLEGQTSLEYAVKKMKQKTRNYAKRQITWFKNQTKGDWNNLEYLLTLPIEKII